MSPSRQDRERLLPGTWARPVLGVLGGMGPAAGVSFLEALVRATPAQVDQEHIDTVLLSHASVPDRTGRLLDGTRPDPTPYLMGDLELLGRLGASLAVIVCNTSHAFLPPVEQLPVRLLSLIEVGAEAAVRAARDRGGEHPSVVLLATDGTLASGLYQEALQRRGATVRLPGETDQPRVMGVIYDRVKAGVPVGTKEFEGFVEELRGGADAVLLGCTELSVLSEQALAGGRPLPPHVVDAQAALVDAVVTELSPGLR